MKLAQIYRQVLETYRNDTRRQGFDKGLLASRYIYRPLSVGAAAIYIKLGFTANQLTAFNLVFLGAAFYCLAMGTFEGQVLGAFLYLWFFITDFADGNIARFHNWTNFFGKLFDGFVDTFGYLVFIPLAYGNILLGTSFFEGTTELKLAVAVSFGALFLQYYKMRLSYFMEQANQASPPAESTTSKKPSRLKQNPVVRLVLWTKDNSNIGAPVLLLASLTFKGVSFFIGYYFLVFVVLGLLEILMSLKMNHRRLYSVSTKLRRNKSIECS